MYVRHCVYIKIIHFLALQDYVDSGNWNIKDLFDQALTYWMVFNI